MKPKLENLSHSALEQRVASGLELLGRCTLCPRRCSVDRASGQEGFCRTGRLAKVASATLHFGEEDVLVGRGGSGTIFFSGCTLGCLFCQNWEISHGEVGEELEPVELARMMLDLQRQGAENINFVTPTHVVPQILEALVPAREMGLELPLVYNCGGYERLSTLALLDGVVDIYMPDAKFWDGEIALRLCDAADYPERARQALREMHRQVGDLEMNAGGVALRGLLVRHLLMPEGLAGTTEWVRFLKNEISPHTYLNIMNQYRPCGEAGRHPELRGQVGFDEYIEALQAAQDIGMTRLDQGGFRLAERLMRRLLG
jgi:putative pyruvate formate lyase activating enzyme